MKDQTQAELENNIVQLGRQLVVEDAAGKCCVDLIEQHSQLHKDLNSIITKQAMDSNLERYDATSYAKIPTRKR